MIVAELTGEAQRHARWDEPDEETTAAAVAEAGVYPPRCPYRMYPSYARNRPASRPVLYEFSLVSGSLLTSGAGSRYARE